MTIILTEDYVSNFRMNYFNYEVSLNYQINKI